MVTAGCSQPAAEPAPAAPPPAAAPPEASVPAVEVRRGDLIESIIVNGQLTSTRETALFFRQSGRLKNLLVATNDRVKAGQVLAELDVGSLSSDVLLAELAAKKAQTKLEQARAKLADRIELQMAELDYEAARITYEKLREQLEAATLAAPFDGLVTDTQGRPGETVPAYKAVIGVADPAALQVTAQLTDGGDAARLAIGQPATFVLDKVPNVRLPVQVVQLPTTAATLPNGTPVPAEVSRQFLLHPTEPLPSQAEMGMMGRVTILLREKRGVLLVKSSAVRAANARRYVQLVQGGRKRDVDVEVGIVTQTDTEIVAGLNEGDKVIDNPVSPVPTNPPGRKGP